MRPLVGILVALGSVVATVCAPATRVLASDCRYVLGFQAMHERIPAIVGACRENERHNPMSGDAEQATTGVDDRGGLLSWRKSDNVTTFTDGSHTWVTTPFGLKERPAGDRFAFELANARFMGVELSFDRALAPSADGRSIAAVPVTVGPGLGGGAPEHVLFTFGGTKTPQPLDFGQPQLRVYPVGGLRALDPSVAKEVSDLRALLTTQPASVSPPLPVFPLPAAPEVFRANIAFVPFKGGSGVRFLTAFRQDAGPITNDGLVYTFQGLTSDDRYYVSMFWPVATGVLPSSLQAMPAQGDMDAFAKNFDHYVATTSAELDALGPSAFVPDLTQLDALAASVRIVR